MFKGYSRKNGNSISVQEKFRFDLGNQARRINNIQFVTPHGAVCVKAIDMIQPINIEEHVFIG